MEETAPQTVPVHFREFVDSVGRLVILPAALVESLRAQGQKTATFEIHLSNADEEQPEAWITSTQAAQLHLSDCDGLTLNASRIRINAACNSGAIKSMGEGRKRRIEPTSLKAWRLDQRERNLDREDRS